MPYHEFKKDDQVRIIKQPPNLTGLGATNLTPYADRAGRITRVDEFGKCVIHLDGHLDPPIVAFSSQLEPVS